MFSTLKKYFANETKKVVLAALVILLCLVSLVGATFALFTNGEDGKIGVNTISGSMDVDLVDTNGDSLLDRTLEFVTLSDDPLYFEPGAMIYTQGFAVKNNGNITINYRIFVSEDQSENMQKFSDAFDIYVSTSATDLSQAVDIRDFNEQLAPDAVGQTFFIILKMKESAGDEFQTQIYSGIGITVHAVQGNVDISEVEID